MIEHWQRAPLADFAELVSTGPFGSILHKSDYVSDGVPLINPINIVESGIVPDPYKKVRADALERLSGYLLRRGDVVVGRRGEIGRCAVVGPEEDGWVCGTGCFFIRPRDSIRADFLAHMLRSPMYRDQLEKASTGATMKNMSNAALAKLPVVVPTVAEQHRVVAILDEAFEGIATVKANAERNLRNASEWSERQLAKTLRAASEEVTPRTLESIVAKGCNLSYGIVQPGGDVPNGLPVVRPVDMRTKCVRAEGLKRIDPSLARSYVRTTLEGGDLLLCVRGTTGTVAVADLALAGANVTRGIVPIRFDPQLVCQSLGYYLLRSEPFQQQVRAKTYGTALMQINIGDLRRLTLRLPPLERQAALVEKLDEVQEAADRLIRLYERKLAALDELKKSLLHQAFTGQLTSSKPARVAQPATLQTTTPEFAANIIALAHARHERQKREKAFGRVKEQKTLHLVEAVAKINLGRQPMRDAAGPNDFQHMLRAEEWAKASHFFEMVPIDGRYEFKKLSAFEARLSEARQALAPYLPQLESVIDLLVPMDKTEAEVFATVLAAWNNLLIEGAAVTDDAIVLAARDDWHADKHAIAEHRFRSAIDLIRQKGLVPDGTAKYVGGQQPLR